MQVASREENQQLVVLEVVAAATGFVILGLIISSILYQTIYGWILDSKGFPYNPRTLKSDFGQRNYGRLKL